MHFIQYRSLGEYAIKFMSSGSRLPYTYIMSYIIMKCYQATVYTHIHAHRKRLSCLRWWWGDYHSSFQNQTNSYQRDGAEITRIHQIFLLHFPLGLGHGCVLVWLPACACYSTCFNIITIYKCILSDNGHCIYVMILCYIYNY